MKINRTKALLTSVVLALTLGSWGSASADQGGEGHGDSVVGHVERGSSSVPGIHFGGSVSARVMPDGSFQGHVSMENLANQHWQGEVICVRVSGNNATVGMQITHSEAPEVTEGTYRYVRITDQGGPGNPRRGDSPDFWAFAPGEFELPAPLPQCPTPGNLSLSPLGVSGNFIVTDN